MRVLVLSAFAAALIVASAGARPVAAPGVSAVTLSYHWHDAVSGAAIVWDGRRTPLVDRTITHELIVFTRTLRGGPVFPALSTTPTIV